MLTTLPRSTPTEEILDVLARDGGVIVSEFLDTDRVDALSRDFTPHVERAPWCNRDDELGDEFFGVRTKRLHGLQGKSTHFGELIVDPLLQSMCQRFLKPHCRDFRVSTGELMVLGPGQPAQALHRDADSWPYFPRPRPELLVSANLALTEFTASNGATQVVPGSHRWPADRKAEPSEIVSAVMSRGSAVLYSGEVLHGGGANQSQETRTGLYVGFILSWLRPIENHLITSSVDAIRQASERAQRLLDVTPTGWEVIA